MVFDILFLEQDSAAEEFDEVFAEEMKAAGNVYLPFLMQDQHEPSATSTVAPAGLPEPSPDILKKATIALDDQEPQPSGTLKTYAGAKLPAPLFAQAAHGLGYINLTPDIDGTTRRLPLLARARDQTFLHIATAVARDLLTVDQATLRPRELRLGPMTIPLTAEHEMVIDWHGTLEKRVYPVYPIGAVLRSYTDMQRGSRPCWTQRCFETKSCSSPRPPPGPMISAYPPLSLRAGSPHSHVGAR